MCQTLDKPTMLRHTRHMDECVEDLLLADECPADRALRRRVALQSFAARMLDFYRAEDITHGPPRGEAAIRFSAEGFLRELEFVRASVEGDGYIASEAVRMYFPFLFPSLLFGANLRTVSLLQPHARRRSGRETASRPHISVLRTPGRRV